MSVRYGNEKITLFNSSLISHETHSIDDTFREVLHGVLLVRVVCRTILSDFISGGPSEIRANGNKRARVRTDRW